jgi:dTMP kinase
MSLFITFEGGEGSGKSLQSRVLYRKLAALNIPVVLIHEPGGTPLGEKIRSILKKGCDLPLSPLTELMLFNASRSQLVTDVINPGLKSGRVVIGDRFTDSTLAYQAYGRRLDLDLVQEMDRIACQGLKPDLTFLLDLAPETGLSRKGSAVNDRFEQEAIEFHHRVRAGFLQLAGQDPRRWVVIDACLAKRRIGEIIWQRTCQLLEQRKMAFTSVVIPLLRACPNDRGQADRCIVQKDESPVNESGNKTF